MPYTPGQHHSSEPVADINMTPMVDVTMVLLIVFIITAPLLKQGFEVELPKATPQELNVEQEDSIILSINRQGETAINGDGVSREELGPALQDLYSDRIDQTLYIEADANVAYQRVVTAMDLARRLKLKMSLVYEPKEP